MGRVGWRLWLRSSWNATTLFSLAMIAAMWASVVVLQFRDRHDYIGAAWENGSNLVRAFDESVRRSIGEIDKTLLLLRSRITLEGKRFDVRQAAIDPIYASDLVTNVAIIDANGFRTLSTSTASEQPVDARDREFYRTFLESNDDRLFIGKPILTRSQGKWAVIFARPILSAEGRFEGVIAVSVDPNNLTHFFEIVDIGKEGRMTLIGVEGIILAARGGTATVLGQSVVGSPLLDNYHRAEVGNFYSQVLDGIRRLVSYRKVHGYPLIATVSLSEPELLTTFWRKQQPENAAAFGVTLLILIRIAFNARHKARYDLAQDSVRASEALAREKSRELEITLDHMDQGIMMIDAEHKVAIINHQATSLLDLPEDFLGGQRKFDDYMEYLWARGEFGSDGETLEPRVREFIKAGGLDDIGTYERTRPNGTVLEVRSVPLPGGGLVRTFTDISVRKDSEARIVHMARHDDLTGLANRVLFRERIEQALARSRRLNERFAVLLLDLDRFKDVNDTLGHPAGDALLKIVAQRLCQCVRDMDTVARLGGDEFAIVQSSIERWEDAQSLCRRILDSVGKPYEISGYTLEIGTSIGIAMGPDDATAAEELLKKADIALYCAKDEGRRRWRFFEAAMETHARARHALEADLRKALHNGEFEVHYQPMIDLASNEICGVEALLRWNHPKKGLISPAEFIPVAEETGLILDIGEWIARKACSDAAAWPLDVKIAVNVSPVQFRDKRLVETVKELLTTTGLSPIRLELEITETVILNNNQENLTAIRELRDLGIGIALDDFGTGFSSLSHLRAFPFTKIKIDKSFVQDLGSGKPGSEAIVRIIADLGRSLGVLTLAEGVETRAQLERLRAAGCNQAQGYLFSRPLPARDVVTKIMQPKRLAEQVA